MADYTALEHIDIRSISERYGLGDCTLTKLAGGAANSSFRVDGSSGVFTLTVLDNHDHASAERLARLTRALYAAGVPTTNVVPAVGGDLVTSWGRRPAIIKQWIEGTAHDILPDRFLSAAGRILAQLHSADPGFPDLPVRTLRLSPEHDATIGEFEDHRRYAAHKQCDRILEDPPGDRVRRHQRRLTPRLAEIDDWPIPRLDKIARKRIEKRQDEDSHGL